MAGTLFRSPMVINLSWTIYVYDFAPFPFDRKLSHEKAVFVSKLMIRQKGRQTKRKTSGINGQKGKQAE